LCAKYGILANGGGEAFQVAAKVSCVVFDKTGTLTKGGCPEITDFEILLEDYDSLLWALISQLEKGSSHPLAAALIAASRGHDLISAIATDVEEIPGRGMRGTVRLASTGVRYEAVIGNESWMQENDVEFPSSPKLETWKREAKSIILLAVRSDSGDGVITGRLTVSAIFAATDPVRPDAIPVIAELQRRNIAVWMISGDNHTTAVAVARLVGIPEHCVNAGVLPQEKVKSNKLHFTHW
jgi:P-type Cu+ transporter